MKKSDDPTMPSDLSERWNQSEEPARVVYYQAPVKQIRDRLDLEGYTLAAARRLYNEWRELEGKQRSGWDPDVYPEATAKAASVRNLTADQWVENIRQINDGGLSGKDKDAHKGTPLGEMLDSIHGESWYGYGGPDPLVAIRLALECCREDACFVYDLTDLIESEYLGPDEDPIESTISSSATEYHSLGRTIILTEGPSDTWILKESLALLYPHLAGYFAFMDFAEFRVGGGVGQLANLVKALAGAGIVNRVIAIFDNDAASLAALRSLNASALPKHIVTMRLPDLPSLMAYPTVGPAGLSDMDINGMAASIELYLGHDVLCAAEGRPSPIQWTGYERSVRTYQGELLEKDEVQARFKSKLSRARVDAAYLEAADWTGLRAIFGSVFTAFHDLDSDRLSHYLRWYYRDENA